MLTNLPLLYSSAACSYFSSFFPFFLLFLTLSLGFRLVTSLHIHSSNMKQSWKKLNETRFSFWYKMHFKHQDFSAVVELLQLTDQSCWAGRGGALYNRFTPCWATKLLQKPETIFFIKQSFSSLFKSPLSFVDFFKHWIFTFLNYVSNCKTASFTIFC